MTIENNLKGLNIVLPEPKAPVGAYVASKISGNLLFISGQIPINPDSGDIVIKSFSSILIIQTLQFPIPAQHQT